jgi:hypothetical protein
LDLLFKITVRADNYLLNNTDLGKRPTEREKKGSENIA